MLARFISFEQRVVAGLGQHFSWEGWSVAVLLVFSIAVGLAVWTASTLRQAAAEAPTLPVPRITFGSGEKRQLEREVGRQRRLLRTTTQSVRQLQARLEQAPIIIPAGEQK